MKGEQIPQHTHWGGNPEIQRQHCGPKSPQPSNAKFVARRAMVMVAKGSLMEHSADVDAEFWRDALLAGGFTAIPRWTLDPVPGVETHQAAIPDDLVARLHRLSDELELPLSSVLLAAHAKVLSALSGEHELATGYVAEGSA